MPSQPEIRSEEIQDIMQRTPSWLTRWGITILLLITGMVLAGAFYVSYPDMTAADVLIQSRSRPLTQKAVANRTVRRFLVHDRQPVRLTDALLIWTTGDTLRAAISGKLYWLKSPVNGQEITAGEAIVVIIPVQESYRVIGRLPVAGSGKVAVGQRAIIRLDAYPSQEFGALPATVTALSPLEENGAYAVEFTLQTGLQTASGRQISIITQLRGKAEILTTERNLLKRIFEFL